MYLTAVIDWYSRCIVGWEVDDAITINNAVAIDEDGKLIFLMSKRRNWIEDSVLIVHPN